MKKVLEYVKQYWLTVIFGIGFILLYKYISDNKLFSAMMFPSLGKIWEAFWKERDIMLKNMLSSFELLIPSIGITLAIGYYVRRYCDYGLYANVWAGFLFMVLILVCVMQIFEHLKNYLLKWTA